MRTSCLCLASVSIWSHVNIRGTHSGYVYASADTTDERGRYTIDHLVPGRGYLLMVWSKGTPLDAISSSPTDLRMRAPARAAMFYPGISEIEAASMLILQPGELRDGVDVTMPMTGSTSFCIDGKASIDGKVQTQMPSPSISR